MSPHLHHLPLKRQATTAAADTNCTAVALAECPAAIMSFQRIAPGFPPHKNVDSAAASPFPACISAEVLQFMQKMLQDLQHFEVLETLPLIPK